MKQTIRGEKKLSKYLNKWLKNHGFNDYSVKLGVDFEYNFTDDRIIYALLVGDKDLKYYMNFVQTLGLDEDIDPFVIAFFHELGHGETQDILTDEEFILSEQLQEHYDSLAESEVELTKEDYFGYYTIPQEYEATMWAIDYINEHPKRIRKFQRHIFKLVKNIINKNNIQIGD